MNKLASCGSVWNWSFAQHPQFGIEAACCISLTTALHAPLTWAPRGNCWSEIINIQMCRPKYSICFLNWLLHGNSGQIISAWGEPRRRESWQGESLHSPCCPLGKAGSFYSKKPDPLPKLLLPQKGRLPTVTLVPCYDNLIFLLREPFPLSCTLEMWRGFVLAGLYRAQADE